MRRPFLDRVAATVRVDAVMRYQHASHARDVAIAASLSDRLVPDQPRLD